ncbi:hypothetical protein [Caballeronia sp. DA-9]|uniref:hypothetical protein n=1 Tax=Caballeronia sp. DA-9 TaxID=3436237 RepID=UPI003F67684A
MSKWAVLSGLKSQYIRIHVKAVGSLGRLDKPRLRAKCPNYGFLSCVERRDPNSGNERVLDMSGNRTFVGPIDCHLNGGLIQIPEVTPPTTGAGQQSVPGRTFRQEASG